MRYTPDSRVRWVDLVFVVVLAIAVGAFVEKCLVGPEPPPPVAPTIVIVDEPTRMPALSEESTKTVVLPTTEPTEQLPRLTPQPTVIPTVEPTMTPEPEPTATPDRPAVQKG